MKGMPLETPGQGMTATATVRTGELELNLSYGHNSSTSLRLYSASLPASTLSILLLTSSSTHLIAQPTAA